VVGAQGGFVAVQRPLDEGLGLVGTSVLVDQDGQVAAAQGGLGKVLYDAVNDPGRTRIPVVYIGPKPDLLRHEAQAIMTGEMGEDGVFYADELLLKCPTKYEEAVPEQSEG